MSGGHFAYFGDKDSQKKPEESSRKFVRKHTDLMIQGVYKKK